MIKTYTSSIELTEDIIKRYSTAQKVKILKELGYKGEQLEFAKYKSARTIANKGGGMILRDIKEISQRMIDNNGGSVKVKW